MRYNKKCLKETARCLVRKDRWGCKKKGVWLNSTLMPQRLESESKRIIELEALKEWPGKQSKKMKENFLIIRSFFKIVNVKGKVLKWVRY